MSPYWPPYWLWPLSPEEAGRPELLILLAFLHFRFLQCPVDLGNGRYARLVSSLFDAIEGFRSDASASGQLHLGQAQFAAGAKDVAGLDHGQGFSGGIVAVGQRLRHERFPFVGP